MKVSMIINALTWAAVATASWTIDLNYRSPSERHPGIRISLHKVNKKSAPGKAWLASQINFTHGVASGDPCPTSVILWTRVSPMLVDVNTSSTISGCLPLYSPVPIASVAGSDGSNKVISTAPVCLGFKGSEIRDFSKAVNGGTVYTSSDVDYTVKVEAQDRSAFNQYYYQFNVCGSNNTSRIGRTKTTPTPNDYVMEVGLAIYSCNNFPFGFFNAFGKPARKDSVDYVLNGGDYIYEYAGDGDYEYGYSIGRTPRPEAVILTLDDYRTDLDLLFSHEQFPWIPVWDDHEVADNTYRDGKADVNNAEASFVSDGGIAVDQRKLKSLFSVPVRAEHHAC